MGRYCELMTKLLDKGVEDEVWTISEDMLNKLARKDPMLFEEYIDKLERVVKPLMDERGYIQSAQLKQFIDIPYIVIPEGKFRPVELLPYIKKFIPNIRGLLQ